MRNGWKIISGLSVTACTAMLMAAACASDAVVPWYEPGRFLENAGSGAYARTAVTVEQETHNGGEWYECRDVEENVSAEPVIARTDKEPQGLWSLGEYKLTAYCACEVCCGYWATVRPLDGDGNPIVYTADGSVARQGVTVAADTDILPFGTVLLIDGIEYTVQDRGSGVKGKHIDVYFDSHEEARAFGVKLMEIFRKGDV